MQTQTSFAEVLFLKSPNAEPALDDMLVDPIMSLLMSSDRVQAADLKQLLESARRRLPLAA